MKTLMCTLFLFLYSTSSFASSNFAREKTFPAVFPLYTKCVVGGKRMACYDAAGVSALLMVWNRVVFLDANAVPLVAELEKRVISNDILISKLSEYKRKADKAIDAYKAAIDKKETALKEYKSKIEKERKAATLRLIATGIVVGVACLGLGVGVGVLIASVRQN